MRINLKPVCYNWFGVIVISFLISACQAPAEPESKDDSGDSQSENGDTGGGQPELNCSQTNVDFFSQSLWPVLSENCSGCHIPGGQAESLGSEFIYSANENNALADVTAYIEANGSLFISKPTQSNNVSHGGGQVFSASSSEGSTLSEAVARFSEAACANDSEPSEEAGLDDVVMISPSRTLRKSSILLQGEMPDQESINSALQSDQALKTELIEMMEGEIFEQWLMNSANDHLLTRKYFTGQTEAQEALSGETYRYIDIYDRTQDAFDASTDANLACDAVGNDDAHADCILASELADVAATTYRQTQKAIAEEPLELIRYVVTNDRPYTEILTADYMMMNPFTYEVMDGQTWTTTYDPMDDSDWRPGHIRSYRVSWNTTLQDGTGKEFIPSAGILSSPVFLVRYPSTDTNRNRARARWAYYFFLGTDIERLAVRAMDPEELKNVSNPGDEGTSCFGCHSVMDPVAGAFQSFGNAGEYLVRDGLDSLPQTHVDSTDYQNGDQWYRTQLHPGFNGTDLPVVSSFGAVNGYGDGLQWLAQQMVADPRFATGTAKFWFKGVFGREPLIQPTAINDPDYQALLDAYTAEQALIDDWAQSFIESNFDLKELLAEMMLSPLYRGESILSTDTFRLQALKELGIGRLLTPEQLDRKLVATAEFDWRVPWQDDNQLLENYYMFYGGIDSDGITERANELNAMMLSVAERMANEVSCELVINEFWPGVEKVLFEGVTISTDPNTSAGESAIRSTIRNMMWRLWGVEDSSEETAIWNLYKALYDQRIALGDEISDTLYADEDVDADDEFCSFNDQRPDDGITVELNWSGIDWSDETSIRNGIGSNYNPEQTLRPWIGVLTYMLTDIQFLTE